jgi:hypothetical protein
MSLIFSMFEHNKKTLKVVAPSAFLKIKTKNETTTIRSATSRSLYDISLIISTIIMMWSTDKNSKKNKFYQIPQNINFQYSSIAIILLRNCCKRFKKAKNVTMVLK